MKNKFGFILVLLFAILGVGITPILLELLFNISISSSFCMPVGLLLGWTNLENIELIFE